MINSKIYAQMTIDGVCSYYVDCKECREDVGPFKTANEAHNADPYCQRCSDLRCHAEALQVENRKDH